MRLRAIFDRHNCDRGHRHSYERIYEPLFDVFRDQPLKILEIGIFRGAGIWSWLDYFPSAHIVGVDTFQRVAPDRVEVLKHNRVSWYNVNSTKTAIAERDFDIIIDDGDHRAESQLATFRNYHRLLADGGMYFIEDVWPDKPGYDDLIAALPDGAIHHDNRGVSGNVDSYIIQC